jgi:Flp pilus assembly protein TadD
MLAQQNKNCEAIEAYNHAIALKPDYAKALYGLGAVFEKTGNLDLAAPAYQKAIGIDPLYPEALNNLGVVLGKQGDTVGAIECFTRAIASKPDYPFPLNNLGMLRLSQRNIDEAEDLFRRALDCDPAYPDAMNNLGIVLQDRGNVSESADLYKKVLALRPDHPDALNNLGTIFLLKGDFEKSKKLFEKVLGLIPHHAEAHNNLGNALKNLGRLTEAIEAYKVAISLRKENAEYHNNLAMALLADAQFDAGWQEYEWRWKTVQFAKTREALPKKFWQGEYGNGRVLLIKPEQGFGDTLQFCRYAPMASERGLRVVVEAQPALVRLLGSLGGVERVVATGRQAPEFDFCCPMLSLPTIFKTRLETIPASVPYLHANEDDVGLWKIRVKDVGVTMLKIGLVWAGSSRINSPDLVAADRRRSISPELLAPLLDIPNVCFFSLQKGGPPAPKEFGLVDMMELCRDFADTAALMANLDLVISVDTAIVHLAGSLGIPVWVLNRYDTCWRWLQTRQTSPWYPTLRLFRQKSPGDWNEVIMNVKNELLNTRHKICPELQ